jgi:hypothetical protein
VLLLFPGSGKHSVRRALAEVDASARNARPQESARPQRFVELARGMGIPAHDAARQVMELVETRAMLSPCGSRTTGS